MKTPLFITCLLALIVSQTADAADFVSSNQIRPWVRDDVPFQLESALQWKMDLGFGGEVFPFNGQPKQILEVFQETFGFLTQQDSHQFIGSTSAYPCVNVALFDSRTGMIALGHFDAIINQTKSLEAMLVVFKQKNTFPTHAFLASDFGPQIYHLKEILGVLLQNQINEIKFIKSNTLIVARDGKVFANYFHSDASDLADYPKQAGLIALPGANCSLLNKGILNGRPLLKECTPDLNRAHSLP